MSTINVKDAAGATVALEKPLGPGQALMAASRPVAISSDQSAIPITDNAASLTVDAPVATPVFVRLSDGSAAITTLPASLASLPALAAGTAIIGKVGIDQTTAGTTNGVALAQVGATTVATGNGVAGAGVQRVTIASDNTAFAVTAAQSGTWNITNISGTVSLPTGASTETTLAAVSGKLPASLGAKAGSASLSAVPATDAYTLLPASLTARILSSAATTNSTSIKGSAGAIKSIQGYNARSSPVFLKLYNKATAPTVGSDTPVKTLYLPAAAAFVFDFPAGYSFGTGIGLAMTTAAADADTGAIAAADVICLNVDYL